jgi:hypothetical protein
MDAFTASLRLSSHRLWSGAIIAIILIFMRWLLLSLVLGGVAAALLAVRGRNGNSRPDVGSVSGQWIASHRADQSDH